jgi:DNA-binding beta-propeller fold protein YncE
MQMAFSPTLGMGTAKRRRPEESEHEEARCGRYRPAGLEARVESVALPSLGTVRALAVGADGTVFVCTDSALYAFAGANQVTLIAGSRSETGFRDGLGADARFNKPCGLAVYSDGSLVLADTYNHCLRRVSPEGAVSTFAGCGHAGNADGAGAAARFQYPWNLVVDGLGTIYVSDHGNHSIRRVTPADGMVLTLCGSRQCQSGMADGDSASARFKAPSGLALEREGNLIVADSGNSSIRRVRPSDGCVMTVAGSNLGGDAGEGFADGAGLVARFRYPFAVAVDRNNAIVVADGHNHRLRIITGESAQVTTLAGNCDKGAVDGPGASARFNIPWLLSNDERGRLLVAELGNPCRVRVVTL